MAPKPTGRLHWHRGRSQALVTQILTKQLLGLGPLSMSTDKESE